ncbi:hydantoinase B/oxoprolinase family protein [Aurantivibrio infirmus]
MNPIQLSLFANRIEAICDEMGALLRRTAFSPNIKDRLDFSCAVFDSAGELSAQAAHIPVHLGSMAYAMADIVSQCEWRPGDMLVVNDPFLGGTHLPDVTVVAPIYVDEILMGFVANRAHHANIGSDTPGSMPISSRLDEEGIIIPPTHILNCGQLDLAVFEQLCGGAEQNSQSAGDFKAQISANALGVERLKKLIKELGTGVFDNSVKALNDYAERLAVQALKKIPNGQYSFEDFMDDDGLGTHNISIKVQLNINNGCVTADFSGTHDQVKGNINCPLPVTAAAVFYVIRCLLPAQAPGCAGIFRPIKIIAEPGSLLNALRPAAVAAGNVETSTRITDVVLGALSQAIPLQIPAASHGSMNNIAMGVNAGEGRQAWDYYETVGGGMGANANNDGLSAVQTHMTNTLNTPVESLELHYPLRIDRYQIRDRSGGSGANRGGDGIIREYEFLADAEVTLLTERRALAPWGLSGGEAGMKGENLVNGQVVAGKVSLSMKLGDRLTLKTPGGGGWGK